MDTAPNQNSPEAKLHFLDYWRIIRIRKMVILSVFLLVVTTTTVVSFWMPKFYASKVRIAVEKDNTDIAGLSGQQQHLPFDPYFIQTQYERIQSMEVLEKVIDELGLAHKWAERFGYPGALKTGEAFALLKKRLNVRQVRNTSLIDVKVTSEDPDEAALIANKVAEVYRANRIEQRMNMSLGGVGILRKEFEEKSKEVVAAQQRVDALREELGLTDIVAESGQMSTTLEPETVRRMEAQRILAFTEYTTLKAKLSALRGMSREDLRKGILTSNPDNNLAILLQTLSLTEQQLVKTRRDLSEDHPDIVSLNDLLAKINQQVEDAIEGILIGLETQAVGLKANVEQITAELDQAKEKDREATANNRAYFVAKSDLDDLRRVRAALGMRIEQETIDAQLPKSAIVEITDPAEPDLRPVSPKLPLNIALGIIVGLIAGIGLAFFIEYLDTSVKTIDDVEHALQSQVLSVIPQNAGSLLDDGADSPPAEAYRVLRTNILFARKDEKLNTITVVSGGAGEGKSTTIFNLATMFAQNGHRVLLVDSDLRRPSLHKLFNVSNSVGLTNHLLSQKSLEEVIQTTTLAGLDFLPSGKLPSSSLGILNSPAMRRFIDDIKSRYDFVFFDSPPIMGVSDASVLVSQLDMTLLVIQYRKYPQAMTVRAKQTIDKVGGNLLGVVLNNINISQDAYYYYYSGYSYSHYSNENEEEPKSESNGHPKGAAQHARLDLKQKY